MAAPVGEIGGQMLAPPPVVNARPPVAIAAPPGLLDTPRARGIAKPPDMLSSRSQVRTRQENALSRVAIIGSCITRDLWPILGDAPPDLLYVSRTSLPSLFSERPGEVVIADQPPAPLKRHQHNALAADLTKTALSALVAHAPTHIIFDFIDERFDLLAAGSGFATRSWELEVSGYLAQPLFAEARDVPRLSRACDQLWSDAAAELATLLASTPLSQATLILHEAQWADHYRDADGAAIPFESEMEVLSGKTALLADHNALLDRYQRELAARLPGLARVAAPPELRVASVDHRWGLSPFHYVDAYYAEIWRQLHDLGL